MSRRPPAEARSPAPSRPLSRASGSDSGATAPNPPATPLRLAPWKATGLLLLFFLVGLGILLGPQHALRRTSVDVLDLLPHDQQDPTISLARGTANGRFGRTMLLALADSAHPDKAPVEAARRIAESLAADPSFAGTFSGLTEANKERLGQWFFDRRLPLRLPVWLDAQTARWRQEKGASAGDPDPAWLAAQAVQALNDFQASPDALAAQELLPRDPLLLVPGLLEVFTGNERSTKGVSGGALTGTDPQGIHYALIYAEIKHSPMDDNGQRPVFAALDRTLAAAKAEPGGAGLTLRYSGVNKFAAESRAKAEHEIGILTNISLAASCLVMLLAFRNLTVFAYLLLPIAAAAVWSLVVCFLFFDKLHVVAVVFTTVLLGIAMDYGIYALTSAQRGSGGLRQSLRDIRRPLIAGCLTSVGGFAFLILTNLPMLQQMGLAVALGLFFSLVLDFVYLPWVPALRVESAAAARVVRPPRRLDLSGRLFPVLAVALPLVLAGWVWASRPHWNDDIRALQTMDPQLQDEEAALRKLFGQAKDERIVLTFGSGLDDAFANVEKLNTSLDAVRTDPEDSAFNLSRLFPSQAQSARAAAYLRSHPDFGDALRRALDADFNADAFIPFWDAWAAYLKTTLDAPPPHPSQLMTGLRDVLPLPLHNLWSDENPRTAWLATRISASLYPKAPASAFTAPNTPIDQVQTLNGALRRYRVMALRSGGIGLGIISLCVLVYFGWRRGLFMLMVPLSSMFFALGTFGFLGQPLSLLHIIAHLLGFCLASDYSIFLASPGDLPHSTRRSVRLAGLTALVSFTVLTFSKMEALHDVCLTVALVIGFDLLLCELSHRLFVRPTNLPPSYA